MTTEPTPNATTNDPTTKSPATIGPAVRPVAAESAATVAAADRRRRVRTLAVGGFAVALIGGGAAAAIPAFADSTGAPAASSVSVAPTPTGGQSAKPTITAVSGERVDTSTVPVRCTAGGSGLITFAANADNDFGKLTATGDTTCAANPADAAYITATTPTRDNAYTHYDWNPTASVAWEGTVQDAAGCLVVMGGANTPNEFGNGGRTGQYRITTTAPNTYVEFYGSGCQLHDASS